MSDLISRQEAIDRINKQREHLEPDVYPQDKIADAAYRICEEFIERLPSAQPEVRTEMSSANDTISRQAAIDAVCEYCEYCEYFYNEKVIQSIKEIPSAQPEHTETHECDYQHTETHDLVSRRAAIDSVCEVCENCEYFKNEKLIQTIKDLPPAQPRWIPVTLETLPNLNSVVVVCGKKGTWDYGTYRGWSGDIHSWQWKKNTIKHVYWWMYKADALQEPYKEEQDGTRD